jgi:hypothetical protein
MAMLGSSCSPCCRCLCADTCVYCATLDDGDVIYNSCSSLMFDDGPPTRTSACRGLLTQPVYSETCGGTRILLGDMSGVNFETSPPAPFEPLQILSCFGSGALAAAPGFYFAKIEGTGDPSISSVSTRFRASATALCSNTLSQVNFSIRYYYQVSVSTTSTVDGVLQQKRQITTYDYLLNFARSFSAFPACTGATSQCTEGAGGEFALDNFDAELSIEELSYSINGGLFTDSTETGNQVGQKKTQVCTIFFPEGGSPVSCDDFIDIADGLFEPPVLSFSLFQDAETYPCNPLP